MTDSSDEQLERDFLKNPHGHFRAVYDRYSGPLLRYLYRFAGHRQVAEEILHDVFLELLAGKFRPVEGGGLKSWLFTVAKNRGLNAQKKAAKMLSVDPSGMLSGVDIERQTLERDLLHQLERAEGLLPTEIRETWSLRKRGMDNQEIARVLNIPIGTVKSRFSRLVEYLRKELSNEI